MFRTTLYNLSEDLEHASTDLDPRELGEINAEEMHSLLEFLRHLDPLEVHDAQPYISIVTHSSRYTVRTSSGKLHLYDIARPELGCCELEPAALIHQITPKSERFSSEESNQNTSIGSTKSKRFNQTTAISMLIAGLLLNGYTLYAAFYIDDIHRAPPLTLITDPAEAQRLRDTLAGYYTTGAAPGDRAIKLKPDGSAELFVLVAKGRSRRSEPSVFDLGRRDGKIYLALKPRGQIEVSSQSQISLYGDTYRRTNP